MFRKDIKASVNHGSRPIFIATLMNLDPDTAHTRRILNLSKALSEAGRSVTIVAPDASGNYSHVLSGAGVCLQSFAANSPNSNRIGRLARPLYTRAKLFQSVRQQIRGGKSTLIVYTSPADVSVPLLLLGKASSSCVVLELNEYMSYNEFHSRSRLRYAMHWLGTRVIPRYADGSIAINFRLNDLLQDSGKPVIVIPGLVDVNEVEELGPAKEAGDACDKSSFLVGYIGSGKLGDGLEELVAAFTTLSETNDDFRLRCIGSHAVEASLALTDCDPSVRSRIDSLGWLTRREYLEAISHCDCVVLPRPQSHASTYNFPSRLPEALALGVPVITGNSGSVGDFVKDGGGCLLETDGRADNIAIAILRLSSDRTSRKQMRERCQAVARDSFDYRNYSEPLSEWLWRLEYAAVT